MMGRVRGSPVIVIGASYGGYAALTALVAQLPRDFRAPIFVVVHVPADSTTNALIRSLNAHGKLHCSPGRHGQAFADGRIYVAPADHHMMIRRGRILVTKGAQENRSRPGIDPLFRSAAVAYGNKAIGVVLTGLLDDGTAGLMAIKRCGGICIVQDPADAAQPDMPRNAMAQVRIDHCLPLAEMGPVLHRLARGRFGKRIPVPRDILIEMKIAERVLSDLPSVNSLGRQVPFNCPGCGGVLWEIAKGGTLRYRCHTGHAFTAPVLLAEQEKKMEETLWVALRMFEERKNLLFVMSGRKASAFSRGAVERARASEVHIQRIRAMLRLSGKSAPR